MNREPATMTCPTCRKRAAFRDNPFRPFCSERCRLIDLGKWASGAYGIPGEPVGPEHLAGTDDAHDEA